LKLSVWFRQVRNQLPKTAVIQLCRHRIGGMSTHRAENQREQHRNEGKNPSCNTGGFSNHLDLPKYIVNPGSKRRPTQPFQRAFQRYFLIHPLAPFAPAHRTCRVQLKDSHCVKMPLSFLSSVQILAPDSRAMTMRAASRSPTPREYHLWCADCFPALIHVSFTVSLGRCRQYARIILNSLSFNAP